MYFGFIIVPKIPYFVQYLTNVPRTVQYRYEYNIQKRIRPKKKVFAGSYQLNWNPTPQKLRDGQDGVFWNSTFKNVYGLKNVERKNEDFIYDPLYVFTYLQSINVSDTRL